jgi:hypothetical protein
MAPSATAVQLPVVEAIHEASKITPKVTRQLDIEGGITNATVSPFWF